MTPLDVAQHEAAHVVVGVALGLRLRTAVVAYRPGRDRTELGRTKFDGRFGSCEAQNITIAAGPAWERMAGRAKTWNAWGDKVILREAGYSVEAIKVLTVAAEAILRTRPGAHARVTRALLERGRLTGADIYALARGEKIDRDDEKDP